MDGFLFVVLVGVTGGGGGLHIGGRVGKVGARVVLVRVVVNAFRFGRRVVDQ